MNSLLTTAMKINNSENLSIVQNSQATRPYVCSAEKITSSKNRDIEFFSTQKGCLNTKNFESPW
ncbi:hypothetical protein KHM19_29920 [Leptospira borgpetersenii]|nr:hypothetical protein KHM09_30130 [Leptospira borgpetersenii]GIM23809.1 hypothetical protein KHM19_29920 [Leptospira borgpetersenii]GIM27064.1 hypothetical protein KHM25_29890 [Leptospira borgpetersenii]